MAQVASVEMTSTLADTGLPGVLGTNGKAAVGGPRNGTFGEVFREKAAVAETSGASENAGAKVVPAAQVQGETAFEVSKDKNLITPAAATDISPVLNFGSAKPGSIDRTGPSAMMGMPDHGANIPQDESSDGTRIGSSRHSSATAGPAENFGSQFVKLQATSQACASPAMESQAFGSKARLTLSKFEVQGGVSMPAKPKGNASEAGSAAIERHSVSDKKTAALISTDMMVPGVEGLVVAAQGMAVAGATTSGRQRSTGISIDVNENGDSLATPKQTGLATTYTGQLAAQQTQLRAVAANAANLSVDSSSAGGSTPPISEKQTELLHPGRSLSGRGAPDHAAETSSLAAIPSVQHSTNSMGLDRNMPPQAALLAGAPNVTANQTGATNTPMASPFDRIDQGASLILLHAGSQHVEVGVHDPQLGWVEISAQNYAGHVDARLVAASGQTHSALTAQLPAIAQYLQERDVRVGTLVVQRPTMQTGAGGGQSGGQPGSHTSSSGGGAQHFRGGGSSTTGNEIQPVRMNRPTQANISLPDQSASFNAISYISVRA